MLQSSLVRRAMSASAAFAAVFLIGAHHASANPHRIGSRGLAEDPAAGAADDPATAGERARLRVLIVSGANNHDWKFTTPELAQILEETGRFAVDITYEPSTGLADVERLRGYDAILLDYNGPRWGEAADAAFLSAVHDHGVGVAVVHAANNPFPGFDEYETLVGHLWRQGTGHGAFHEFKVDVVDRDHPITRTMLSFDQHPDELYHKLVNVQGVERRVLAHALSSRESRGTGENEPMILVGSYGAARVFHTPLGHVWVGAEGSKESQRDPRFRDLVARGTEWAATGEVRDSWDAPNSLTAAQRASGWRLLFDGASSDGWRGYRKDAMPDGWRIEDGWMKTRPGGSGGDVITSAMFGDFELALEWRVTPGANSGVIFRVHETEDASYKTGPEFQILDDAGHEMASDSNVSAGALYGLASPTRKVLRTVDGVNRSRIRVRGMHVEHFLNGHQIVDFDLGSEEGKRRIAASKFSAWPGFAAHAVGHIVLQDHGGEVWYRSLRVRELTP